MRSRRLAFGLSLLLYYSDSSRQRVKSWPPMRNGSFKRFSAACAASERYWVRSSGAGYRASEDAFKDRYNSCVVIGLCAVDLVTPGGQSASR